RRLLELGITPFPEQYGGGGLGMVEQAIILEEMGRIPYPGPYFASIVLAGSAINASGDDAAKARYLPDAGRGDLVMTLAFLEEAISWEPSAVALTVQRNGNQLMLNG